MAFSSTRSAGLSRSCVIPAAMSSGAVGNNHVFPSSEFVQAMNAASVETIAFPIAIASMILILVPPAGYQRGDYHRGPRIRRANIGDESFDFDAGRFEIPKPLMPLTGDDVKGSRYRALEKPPAESIRPRAHSGDARRNR